MKRTNRNKTIYGQRIPPEIKRAATAISLKEGCSLVEAYRRLAQRSKRYNIW